MSQRVKQRVKKLFLGQKNFNSCIIIIQSQIHPSEKITKQLTVRGGGSTLTVSLTIKYHFFYDFPYRYHEIYHQNHNILWLQISWDFTQEPQYLMTADFMRYYTWTGISYGCRFHEILYQNHNISWLQISWDLTPNPWYLMVTDFMRYYTRTTISSLWPFCLFVFVFFLPFVWRPFFAFLPFWHFSFLSF